MKTIIGRTVTANPFEGERYFMRILLNHVRGPLSFEDLRTVEGILAPTFREAATMHGLLQRDSSLEDCSHEASLYQMPSSQSLLQLNQWGKNINSYHLLDEDISFDGNEFQSREIDDELGVEIPEEDIRSSISLNNEQQQVYNVVLEKVLSNQNIAFFVDGPGGRTANSRFKLPLDIDEKPTCCPSVERLLFSGEIFDMYYLWFVKELDKSRFPGEAQRYYSVDETIDKTEQSVMEDFLNTLTPNGLPPYELLLKKNCPSMLLRNINPSEGLCNGTHLICRAFDRNIIDAVIAVGDHMGKRVFIPRIPFLPSVNDNSGFPFERT
ncbi:uncharacterized protein LOC133806060 [Humulus lupulus]|uniref:uncharacterized protein LOC133806060 n=1 Tax=Humulus lupulus TaxID=3486 RepID=UPI002B40E55A|nr:uncharacterized protein LOC133806060 [Humulus lupulus]